MDEREPSGSSESSGEFEWEALGSSDEFEWESHGSSGEFEWDGHGTSREFDWEALGPSGDFLFRKVSDPVTALFTNPAAGRPPDATAHRGRSPIDRIWPFFLLYRERPVVKEPPDW